jgi:ubiquinone/menaquinone biosynthesis C-methylase UbiE/uncharacterized protein YbaR (Trm112 family)
MGQPLANDDISLLRCVGCGQSLREAASAPGEWPRLAGEIGHSCLECSQCRERYPITTDGIPIIWTRELRQCVLDEVASNTALSANIAVYNHVSDDYARYWRKDSHFARRMREAARQSLGLDDSARPGHEIRHLDIGCGPGHVLHWLCDLPSKQYALDVSLANLRNARASSRAFAVLGSADCLPFRDGAFDLVTESSVLHHIEKWDSAVREFARVCAADGGLVIDWEPSRESKEWSRLAIALFELRWYPYMLLSHFSSRKFWFRDPQTAKLTFEAAEIHNKANTGLPVDRLLELLEGEKMKARAIRSPDEHLAPKARMPWQEMLLHLLSGHNPLSARYGWFSVVGRRGA